MIETFTAADGTSLSALANWSKWDGAGDIVINSLGEARSSGSIAKYLHDIDLGTDGVIVSIPVRNTVADYGVGGILMHCDPANPSNGYFTHYSGGTLTLYKSVSGTSISLGSASLSIPVRAVGSEDFLEYGVDSVGNHEVSFAAVSLITVTDTTYTSGKVGLRLDNADFRVDTFTAVAMAAAPDITAPVITLNADAVIQLEVGDTYVPAVPTATDNVDGDITANIVTTGDTVDTGSEGSYVRLHNVSDAAGNPAIEVTETINVVAAAVVKPVNPPVITNITVGETTASVLFTHAGGDATSFKSRLNGGPIVTGATSPIDLSSLSSGAAHSIEVAASNSAGDTWAVAEVFNTDAPVVVLRGVRGDAIPSTGWRGFASIIYPFIDPVAEAADKFYAVIVGPVPAGLTLNDDGSFEWSSLAVGFHRFNFQIYKNEVAYGPVRINEAECKAA
ncbi:MAG: immunoglobulin-like domain-containing protein [Pseudomonadales bacterium]